MRVVSFGIIAVVASLAGGCATGPRDIAPSSASPQQQLAPVGGDALPSATTMPDSNQPAAIPSGFIGFCLRFSDQCDLPAGAPTAIRLTRETWNLLDGVNRNFNSSIHFVGDNTHYGVTDYWTIATDGRGDCDDFALTKRKALIDAGLPAAALRIAMVLTSEKEQHAVLTVKTDHGDFVLDNLSSEVRPWATLPYAWFERQNATNSWRWDKLFLDNSNTLASR